MHQAVSVSAIAILALIPYSLLCGCMCWRVHQSLGLRYGIIVMVLLGVAGGLIVGGIAHGAEPRRATLTLALDSSDASRMLKAELERDWKQPNPELRLTRRQRHELDYTGNAMSMLQHEIRKTFRIVYTTADEVPMPTRLHLPAVRINRGRWESIDRRAFAFETRPLLTLAWYKDRHVALFNPDAKLADIDDYCSLEGWSGLPHVDLPAPWDPQPERIATRDSEHGD